MKYEPVHALPRALAERLLSGSIEEITKALLGITYYEADREWVFGRLEAAATHPDKTVRSLVATCVGHIARIDHEIDLARAGRLLDRLAGDVDVAGRVGDAWSDIETFTASRRR